MQFRLFFFSGSSGVVQYRGFHLLSGSIYGYSQFANHLFFMERDDIGTKKSTGWTE